MEYAIEYNISDNEGSQLVYVGKETFDSIVALDENNTPMIVEYDHGFTRVYFDTGGLYYGYVMDTLGEII